MSEATKIAVEPAALSLYCPCCGAYLLTLGCTGELECDQCGEALLVEEAPAPVKRV